jgi:hypothetical protein
LVQLGLSLRLLDYRGVPDVGGVGIQAGADLAAGGAADGHHAPLLLGIEASYDVQTLVATAARFEDIAEEHAEYVAEAGD